MSTGRDSPVEKMNKLNEAISPELLTEDGLFDVGSTQSHVVTKNRGKLCLVETISLTVVEQFGAYTEAKKFKISPDLKYCCFVGNDVLKLIEFETQEEHDCHLDTNFSIEHILWSPDSKMFCFTAELGIYQCLCDTEGNKHTLSGPDYSEYNRPLSLFSPCGSFFSTIICSFLVTYSTTDWKEISRIQCFCCPSGLIYINGCSVGIWNSVGGFVVYSLIGEKLWTKTFSMSSRIKAAKMCNKNRVLVLSTFNDMIFLFDSLTMDCLYELDYPLVINNPANTSVWIEPSTDHLNFEGKNFTKQMFTECSKLLLSKNVCDQFEIKTNKKYLVDISSNNELLASYSPGFVQTVWIRNMLTGRIYSVISLRENTVVHGLKWHPEKLILAVTTPDSVIFWIKKRTFAVYCKSLLTSFSWFKSQHVICSIGTNNKGVLVYIKD